MKKRINEKHIEYVKKKKDKVFKDEGFRLYFPVVLNVEVYFHPACVFVFEPESNNVMTLQNPCSAK